MNQATFKIVQTIAGKLVVTTPTDIYAWAQVNDREVYQVARTSHLRPELRSQPRIQGLCGPMWDGYDANRVAVIRYEDSQTNDFLST